MKQSKPFRVPPLTIAASLVVLLVFPAQVARAADPEIQDSIAPPVPPDTTGEGLLVRIDGLPVDSGAERASGSVGTEMETSSAQTIRVVGRIVYRRPSGELEGLDQVAFFVVDDDPVPDVCPQGPLAFDHTDQYGNFDVTFDWPSRDPWCDQDPDIVIRFYPNNSEVHTATVLDFRGTFIDFGTITSFASRPTENMHVFNVTRRVTRWFAAHGYPMLSSPQWIRIIGTAQSSLNPYWTPPLKDLATYDTWNDPVIARLTTEEWMLQYGAYYPLNLCDGMCDGTGEYCGYCTWCPESEGAELQKGAAEWMAEEALTDGSLGYTLPAVRVDDYETVGNCGLEPVSLWETPGIFAACLHDMSDSVNEDDPDFPTGRDAMSWGPDFALQIMAEDKPAFPGDFFADFRARYPEACEQMWLTAANVGYDLDGLPPNAITGFGSSSHTPGVSSTNARVTLNWTEPADDCFASKKYSVNISASPQLPDAVAEIGDVSTWTTGVIAPGTWYITLRVGDLSDNWRTDYATFGPVVIANPTPANLANVSRTGWAAPVVPRGSTGATTTSVPAPTLLTGNSAATWWNVSLQNLGGASTGSGSGSWVMADGLGFYSPFNPPEYAASVPTLTGGQAWQAVNLGPLLIKGGRHTFGAYCDFTGLVAESNEDDNYYAKQWVWSPYVLAEGGSTYRLAPPYRSGGWDHATGPLYYNCDGVRFTSTGWWNALTLFSADADADYDARLCVASTGASNGFANNVGWSALPAGFLDAVFVNRNQTGIAPWDVGILQSSDVNYTSSYQVQHILSVEQAYGDSVEVTLGPYEGLSIREVYLPVGWQSAIVRLVSGQGPLHLLWLSAGFVTGDMDDYDAMADPDEADVTRLEVNAASTDYNGFVVYRDPSTSAFDQPVTFTFQVVATPPDFKPNQPAGWAGAVVPRPADDGLPGSVPEPTTLTGWATSTWLNFSSINDSPVAATLPTINQVLLDDQLVYIETVPSYPAGGVSSLQPSGPVYVRGGRHTVSLRTDAPEERLEISETNNRWAVQYGWSPAALPQGVTVGLPHPGDPFGGWADLPAGPYWPNSDGYRTPTFTPGSGDGTWAGVAAMPGAASDVDLLLHEANDMPATAFTTTLATSSLSGNSIDFVAVDLDATNYRTFDVGITHGGGTEGFDLEVVTSSFLGTDPTGSHGPFPLGAGSAMALHAMELTGGHLRIRLQNLSSDTNLDLAVFPPEGDAFGPEDAVEGGRGAEATTGEDEWVDFPVSVTGTWCVAVTKAGSADLANTASYRLEFMEVTGVAEESPAVLPALLGAHPNPFHLQTNVAFELERDSDVALDVYDLEGRRVRRLAEGTFTAGRHEMAWNGCDDGGRYVASGIYFVRFVRGKETAHINLLLMR